MPTPNSAAARDIATMIHPYTNLDAHRTVGPMIVNRGEGVYIFDDEGKRYLDGMAALWSASLGFSEKRLVAAATRQMEQLPYSSIFGHRSNNPAIDLAEKLLSIVPKGLAKVLFSCSGSEANDQAVKLVWYYHNAIGKPRKKKVIAARRGYHGVTIYAASLTGQPVNHADFDLPLGGVLRTDCPSHYLYGLPGESEAAFVERIVGNLESLILREGPETIGAFIAEPVNGGGGVIVPPPGYFQKVQEVLRRYDILFIADEGDLRLRPHRQDVRLRHLRHRARHHDGRQGAVGVVHADLRHHRQRQDLRRPGRAEHQARHFGHGFTYAGHPVAAAVALETLKIYEERDLVGMVGKVSPHFLAKLKALGHHPLVGETRGVGLIGAVQFTKNKATRENFVAADGVGAVVMATAQDKGVILRATPEAAYLCPPLIISESEIDEMFDGLRAGLDAGLAHAEAKDLLARAAAAE
jgi:4-aminobutyrate--pyruvate transaminase